MYHIRARVIEAKETDPNNENALTIAGTIVSTWSDESAESMKDMSRVK